MYRHVLHDHLDGGLRPSTAKELAVILKFVNDTNFLSTKSRDLFRETLRFLRQISQIVAQIFQQSNQRI